MASAIDYYEDEASHGNYQYIPLSEIINRLLLNSQDDDSYLKNIKRSRLLSEAKNGIRELNKSVANDILSIEVTIGEDLKWVLPQDYVNYVRVSVVGEDFKLFPLNVNRNISIATGYLQDNDYEILFDEDGEVLTADSSNGYNKPYKRYKFVDGGCMQNGFTNKANKISQYGEFTIDERRGCILFSSDLMNKEIVLEYISDGVNWERINEDEVTVHKHLSEALNDYIYYFCIAGRRNVPVNEKQRALRRYKTTKHQAKIDRMDFSLIELDKEMRGKSRWI